MPVTNYFGNEILNYNFIGTPYIPGDANNYLYFGLSTSLVTAQDVACNTVTEPPFPQYYRIASYNGNLPTINVLGIDWYGTGGALDVTLFVDHPTNYQVGDMVTITGVNAGFGMSNIDGTWMLIDVQDTWGRIRFNIAHEATGAFPQAISLGNVTAMSYTGSDVTLTVDDASSFTNGDIINVTGVNAGAPVPVTNIDGTWTLTSVSGSDLLFTVSTPPTGDTPQTMTLYLGGHVYATKYLVGGHCSASNWSTSTDGSLYNNNIIIFNGTGGNTFGPIVSIFIADDPNIATGNVLAFYTMPTPFSVTDLQITLPTKSIIVSQPTTCGTTFTINRILNYNFGNIPYTPDDGASKLWLGLSTTIVDDTGLASVTEPPTADNYSRQGFLDSNWSASTGVNPPSGVANNAPIYFSTPSATWGEIRSLFISDSATRAAGNILWYKTLSPSIYVPLGMVDVFFNPGEIVFNMA